MFLQQSLTYHRAGNMAKGMSLRYGVIVFGDLTQAQHQIGDTKLLIFFHTTQKKSTSLQVYESTGCRNFENSKLSSLLLLHIADFLGGEGVKKAAWERGGFQAAAYLD